MLDIYSLVVFVAALSTWVDAERKHPVSRFLDQLTEPALRPIRRLLPRMAGFDISPFVLILLIQVLRSLLLRL
ncbi:YggT family protein [bacterium]|nr:YggT family protein [bacterium]